jgi:heparosan-N-sulfate-glucuronate 5-epimerase
MAQGQGISLLVRAYLETGRQEYLETAICAARALHHSITEGGVTWKLDPQTYFYEEIPTNPPTSILNGHFFALWGLFDLETAGVSEFHGLWEAGVNGLKMLLPRFDVVFRSSYDLS